MIKVLDQKNIKMTKDENFCEWLNINITYPFKQGMAGDIKKCCPEMKTIIIKQSPYFGYWDRDVGHWITEYNKLNEENLKKIPKHEIEFFEKAKKFNKEINKVKLSFRKIKRQNFKIERSTANLIFWGIHPKKTSKDKKIDVQLFVGTTGRFYIKEDVKWGSRTRLRFSYQYYTYNMKGLFIQRLFKKELKPLIKEIKKVKSIQEKKIEDISERYKEDCAKYLVFSKL